MKVAIFSVIASAFTIFISNTSFAGFSCSTENARNNSCFDLVKHNADAGLGNCLAKGAPKDISGLLQRNGIRAFTGFLPKEAGFATRMVPFADTSDPRIVALARVVEAYELIGGDQFTALKDGNNVDVIFAGKNSAATNSRRYGSQIQIAPGNQNSTGTLHTSTCGGQDNHGLIAHELAHYIVKANDFAIFNAYQKAMNGGTCKITQYAAHNRTEEIAEVMAAYITMPEAFTNKGAECNRAFDYMKTVFNEPRMKRSCEARKASYRNDNVQWARANLGTTPRGRDSNR